MNDIIPRHAYYALDRQPAQEHGVLEDDHVARLDVASVSVSAGVDCEACVGGQRGEHGWAVAVLLFGGVVLAS